MKEVPIEVKPIFSADNEEEVVKMTYILRQLLLVRNGTEIILKMTLFTLQYNVREWARLAN